MKISRSGNFLGGAHGVRSKFWKKGSPRVHENITIIRDPLETYRRPIGDGDVWSETSTCFIWDRHAWWETLTCFIADRHAWSENSTCFIRDQHAWSKTHQRLTYPIGNWHSPSETDMPERRPQHASIGNPSENGMPRGRPIWNQHAPWETHLKPIWNRHSLMETHRRPT